MSAPGELLADAREMVEATRAASRGWWGRGAAFLGRQALEEAVAHLLARRGADPRVAPFTAQLVALEGVVDTALAQRARTTWVALSAATHFQAYELPPTAAEMRSWLAVVQELIEALEPPAR